MSDQKVIAVGSARTGMPARMAIALMNLQFYVVNCDGGQTRGESELKQLLDPPPTISGDMFKGLLPKEPKPARKQEPYYRRFEKRKF